MSDQKDEKTEEIAAPAPEKTEEKPAVEVKAQEPKKTEEAKPAPLKAPEVKAEEPKKAPEAKKEPSKKLPAKLEKLAHEMEGLTVLEMADLASYLEEKFGVSAMPMAMTGGVAGGAVASGAAAAPAEEKSTFTVVLAASGDNKLGVIKALREFRQDLGLMDAKKIVETAPQNVLENAKKDDAQSAKKKLEGAGAKVELK